MSEETTKTAGLTGQAALEAHARETLRSNNEVQKDTMNGMMKSGWGGCSFEDKTLTFVFPVQQWQANRVGNMHGGAICTAFDLTIAALARFYARENFAPTINLDVNYIRPVSVGDTLIVTAKATSTGRRITQLTAEAKIGSSGKLAATATSIYMNVDTQKERLPKNDGPEGSGDPKQPNGPEGSSNPEQTDGPEGSGDPEQPGAAPSESRPKKKSGQTGYLSSLMNYSDRL